MRQRGLWVALGLVLVSTATVRGAPTYTAGDLTPIGFTGSQTSRMKGTQPVGYGWAMPGGNPHALLWSGTAESYVDLNPSGFTACFAYAIIAAQQAGYGWATPGDNPHDLLWSGTTESYADLNPGGFAFAEASVADGTQQIGWLMTQLLIMTSMLALGMGKSSIRPTLNSTFLKPSFSASWFAEESHEFGICRRTVTIYGIIVIRNSLGTDQPRGTTPPPGFRDKT